MATTTPNFGWPVPTSTDLVKDGATAMEALGDAIDTSMVDLKGGTTGQVLAKASNTDMDFSWVAQDDSNAIQNTIVDAKGDLIAASAADTPARLAVGTNGQVLTADSTAATGLAWATASGGSTYVAGKNLIINGGFDIWQRGTGSIALGALGDYTADRWQGYRASGGGGTVSRQVTGDTTNLPFIQYCARVQRASGNTSTATILFVNSSETVNCIPYAGKQVTFSFYARAGANFSATSSQLTVQLQTGTGTDQNALMTGYTGLTNAVNSTATLTTTWQRFTYTATLGATITEIAPYFTFAPTGTAGANDYYEITGVQVEIASSATAFSRNAGTIQGELAACQRYYYRSTSGTSFGSFGVTAVGSSSTIIRGVLPTPVSLRTIPTSIDFANLCYLLNFGGGVTAITNATIFSTCASAAAPVIEFTTTGATTNSYYQVIANNSATAYIGLSAEL